MELKKIAEERRSVRAYQACEVSKAQVEEIVSFAQNAPSWKNSETGKYYVALSPEAVSAVYDALPDFNKNSTKNVSCYLVVTFEKGKAGFAASGAFANVYGDEWGAYDLGCQNMLLMLKAREMGLDTLVMGLRDEAKLRAYFSIPETEEVMAVLSLGKRAVDPQKPVRKALADILTVK